MYLRDVFPESGFVGFFEWFYDSARADMRFSGTPLSLDARMEVQIKNIPNRAGARNGR